MKTLGTKTVEIIVSLTCDCCGMTTDDGMEMQEFLHYKDTVGYGAKCFSDMDSLELDLCEKCKFELLGKYIRMTGYYDIIDFEAARKVIEEEN